MITYLNDFVTCVLTDIILIHILTLQILILNLTFYRLSKTISSPMKSSVAIIYFNNVLKKDEGRYFCRASSVTGIVEDSIQLIVEETLLNNTNYCTEKRNCNQLSKVFELDLKILKILQVLANKQQLSNSNFL